MKMVQKQKKAPMAQVKSLLLSLFSKKVSGKKKLMVGAIVLYIISPIDFIPDFIPVAGYVDDVILPILLIIANKLLSDNSELETNKPIKEAEKVQ